MFATSSGAARRPRSEVGRCSAMNARPAAATASSSRDSPAWASSIRWTPSVIVGPGSTALIVTPRPGIDSAMPRETASCAVLVMP